MTAPREYTDAFIIIKKLFLGGLLVLQSISKQYKIPCNSYQAEFPSYNFFQILKYFYKISFFSFSIIKLVFQVININNNKSIIGLILKMLIYFVRWRHHGGAPWGHLSSGVKHILAKPATVICNWTVAEVRRRGFVPSFFVLGQFSTVLF